MIVERAKTRVKCDASGCDNLCDYVIENRRFVFDGSIYLCKDCLNTLYKEIGKFIVPKGVAPIFKKRSQDE